MWHWSLQVYPPVPPCGTLVTDNSMANASAARRSPYFGWKGNCCDGARLHSLMPLLTLLTGFSQPRRRPAEDYTGRALPPAPYTWIVSWATGFTPLYISALRTNTNSTVWKWACLDDDMQMYTLVCKMMKRRMVCIARATNLFGGCEKEVFSFSSICMFEHITPCIGEALHGCTRAPSQQKREAISWEVRRFKKRETEGRRMCFH